MLISSLIFYLCRLLTLIMASPYENKEDWTIVATKFENTIYLFRVDKQDDSSSMSNNRNPLSGEMTMWGFKFEQYLCSGKFFIVVNIKMLYNYNGLSCTVKPNIYIENFINLKKSC